MAISWQRVFSSNVDQVGYDADTSELYVQWVKGRTSVYSGVDAELAKQIANAPSVGGALNEFIKPFYAHRYG